MILYDPLSPLQLHGATCHFDHKGDTALQST